jgi:hypothetical protein
MQCPCGSSRRATTASGCRRVFCGPERRKRPQRHSEPAATGRLPKRPRRGRRCCDVVRSERFGGKREQWRGNDDRWPVCRRDKADAVELAGKLFPGNKARRGRPRSSGPLRPRPGPLALGQAAVARATNASDSTCPRSIAWRRGRGSCCTRLVTATSGPRAGTRSVVWLEQGGLALHFVECSQAPATEVPP